MAVRTFTRDEVAKHNKDGDLWVVIDAVVYDLSKFAKFHPGGVGVLLDEDVGAYDGKRRGAPPAAVEPQDRNARAAG